MKMKNSQQPQPSQNDEKHQQHSNIGENSAQQQQQPSPSSINEDKLVKSWTSQDVKSWLEGKGHPSSVVITFTNQEIDGKCILLLTESDIRNDLGIRILTQLKRVYFDILELQQNQHHYGLLNTTNQNAFHGLQFQQSFDQVSSKTSMKHRRRRTQYKQRYKRGLLYDYGSDSVDLTADEIEENLAPSSSSSQRSQDGPVLNNTNSNEINFHNIQHQQHELARAGYATHLEPEIWKALVAMAYVFVVTWITALVMVIVHDRVPDMKKYPPLPDLFLDNMPHIPWAFEMCEVTGTFLFALWFGVLFFHKHRFILIRRFFALSGTVFLLRCVTMLITSLSVPGTHLRDQCNPRPYGDWASRLYNAYLIWKGAGMSIQGVRTCGDYMFSGHTVALTMLNFFVTEYTTRRLYFIHTFSWLLNMFGIFFILAAHEHYSIDVFIAFYITSRLFLYYHTLSNNQALMTVKTKNIQKTKVWFPLFSFFESSVDGIVPNQYEWPITPQRISYLTKEFFRVTENKWKEWLTLPENGFLMMKSKAFLLKPTAGRVFSATSSRMRMFKRNSRAEAD